MEGQWPVYTELQYSRMNKSADLTLWFKESLFFNI